MRAGIGRALGYQQVFFTPNHLSSLPTLFVETEAVNLELTDEAGLTGQQASGILLFIASLVTKVQLLCTGQVLPRSLGSELTSSCQQTLD